MTKARDLADGASALSAVSATELGYLDGVTSAVQTQIDTKLASATAATTYKALADEFSAGKNKIINGDFGINQRAFTSTTTTATYGFDRWRLNLSGATGTYSAQTFTLGEAPVAGYEGKNFARLAVTVGNDTCELQQRIESVRTFANQTVTVSFWAKGTNPVTDGGLYIYLNQSFGTGGSPSTQVTSTPSKFVLTANWTRYSATFNVPSISGKTLGTNNDDFLFVTIGQGPPVSTESWTLDLWGVQVEAGSTATPFQTATGTKQGELAACQRYYWRSVAPTSGNGGFGIGLAQSTSATFTPITFGITMRDKPTTLDYSLLQVNDGVTGVTVNTMSLSSTTASGTNLNASSLAASVTQFRPYLLLATTNGYIGFGAEL